MESYISHNFFGAKVYYTHAKLSSAQLIGVFPTL
jgi:hypothetical protein